MLCRCLNSTIHDYHRTEVLAINRLEPYFLFLIHFLVPPFSTTLHQYSAAHTYKSAYA